MSSSRRKTMMRHPEVVDIGCGCRRPKLAALFSSMPKPETLKTPGPFSPSAASTSTTSYWETSLAAATTSSSDEDTSSPSSHVYSAACESSIRRRKGQNQKKKKKKKKKEKGVVEQSEAVVKESSDPYVDFRDSMLHMIVEKEIYAWDDLKELLHRFLSLNSPYHHHFIFRAFTEVWNGLLYRPPPPHPGRVGGSVARGDCKLKGKREEPCG